MSNLNNLLDEIAQEALASGDQNILDLIEQAAELTDGGKTTPASEAVNPNLIERMEELCAALDEAREALPDGQTMSESERECEGCIDNAYGIAGEVLTMIDGR